MYYHTVLVHEMMMTRSVAAYTLSRHGMHIGRLKIIGKSTKKIIATFKGIQTVRIEFFLYILKVANI